MRKIHPIVLCLGLFVSISATSGKKNVAVMDLEGRGIDKYAAQTLSDRLRSELLKTEKFVVVERGQMNEILKEQGFQQTGCTSQECVVEMGQLMGVQGMIAGSIGKVGNIFVVSARIVNVETGQIIRSVDHETEGEIGDMLKYGMRNVALKLAGKAPEKAPPPKATTQPELRKRSVLPWMVLGAFVVGGGGAGYYFFLRDDGTDQSEVPTGTVGIEWE